MEGSSFRPYPSDLTDEQWELIAPMVPVKAGVAGEASAPADRGSDPASGPHRLRVADAAARLPALGHGVLVLQTLERRRDDRQDPRRAARNAAGRDPMASAGIVDSQSLKGADTVGAETRGYDAGKKTNGRKRHVVVDTTGLLVVLVTSAAQQDRDGGRLVLERARMKMPSIALVWADGGYAGQLVAFALRYFRIAVEIVKKPAGQRTFEVLPRRWVVERTLSWLVRCRRLDRDYERLPAHAEAILHRSVRQWLCWGPIRWPRVQRGPRVAERHNPLRERQTS